MAILEPDEPVLMEANWICAGGNAPTNLSPSMIIIAAITLRNELGSQRRLGPDTVVQIRQLDELIVDMDQRIEKQLSRRFRRSPRSGRPLQQIVQM